MIAAKANGLVLVVAELAHGGGQHILGGLKPLLASQCAWPLSHAKSKGCCAPGAMEPELAGGTDAAGGNWARAAKLEP